MRSDGWISPRKAKNVAVRLHEIADAVESSLSDEGGDLWAREIRKAAKRLDPARVSAAAPGEDAT